MVPLNQAVGGGLEHDCSTWDEIYENEDNETANAWNAPFQAKARMIAMWRLLSPRLPMPSSLAKRLSCGRMPRALSSDRTEPGDYTI